MQQRAPSANEAAGAWDALDAELDLWRAAGRRATFWWRDDDATQPGPRLERLLRISDETGAPVALAVIPAPAEPGLMTALRAHPGACVLQHGYAHVNHAPRGEGRGAWELGLHRGKEAVLADLAKGFGRLSEIAEDRFVHVIAAPWNRIAPELFPDLPGLGFVGVSAFKARAAAEPVAGLRVNNAHCDPIKWKQDAAFTGDLKAVGQVVDHLRARRTGEADAGEATGLLTHHLRMDEATWAFSGRLIGHMAGHEAVSFLGAPEIFAA